MEKSRLSAKEYKCANCKHDFPAGTLQYYRMGREIPGQPGKNYWDYYDPQCARALKMDTPDPVPPEEPQAGAADPGVASSIALVGETQCPGCRASLRIIFAGGIRVQK